MSKSMTHTTTAAMSATTAQAVQHEPWCTDHVTFAADHAAQIDEAGWCHRTFWQGEGEVTRLADVRHPCRQPHALTR